MKKASQVAALFGAASIGLLGAGCNTIEGFGKDLQAAGAMIAGTPKDEKKAPSASASSASPAPAPAAAPAPAPAASPPPAPQRR
jgi:predicted small secreted protein